MWFLQPNSDTGLEVLVSWLKGGMRGQSERALPRLTSVGRHPRQTRLQNPSLAGVDWEAGITGWLSPAKRGKTTGQRDEAAPGATHSDSAPARILASVFWNSRASLDSAFYHPRVRVAWDRTLGQPQMLPDR